MFTTDVIHHRAAILFPEITARTPQTEINRCFTDTLTARDEFFRNSCVLQRYRFRRVHDFAWRSIDIRGATSLGCSWRWRSSTGRGCNATSFGIWFTYPPLYSRTLVHPHPSYQRAWPRLLLYAFESLWRWVRRQLASCWYPEDTETRNKRLWNGNRGQTNTCSHTRERLIRNTRKNSTLERVRLLAQ